MHQFKYKNFVIKKDELCCLFYVFENQKYVGQFHFDFRGKFIFESACTLYDLKSKLYTSQSLSIHKKSPYDILVKQIKKGLDFYLTKSKSVLQSFILNYRFFYSKNGFDFDLTCNMFPEQYDVYYNKEYIGYIRIRYGHATFTNYPTGNIVYLDQFHEYNQTDQQKFKFLNHCIQKYLTYKEKRNEFRVIRVQ